MAGGRNRYPCPACGKQKTFTRYIDIDTGQQLGAEVGKCSRLNNCGYHYAPKDYFKDHPKTMNVTRDKFHNPAKATRTEPPSDFDTIPIDILNQSLSYYANNPLAKWLRTLFGADVMESVARKYLLGTSRHWNGSTVFWQVDSQGRARAGKVMDYNPSTGRRIKVPENRISWAHSLMGKHGYKLRQCLFGEHLLKQRPQDIVGVVESEKTALIASIYLPRYIWLATGGVANLNADTCQCLCDRRTVFFPDLGAYELWKEKSGQLGIMQCKVSDYLEKHAKPEERKAGYDLADYFIHQDKQSGFAICEGGYPVFWDWH